jgi:AraC family transcriptional regulator
MNSRTRKEYIARINRVIDYIGSNLYDKLTLEELADVAAFSPFHFHRIFKTMVGESLSEFINRLRLERAATRLQYNPDLSITEISLECGYSSSSHFARAFKKHFGYSASEYRNMVGGENGIVNNGINEDSNISQPISKNIQTNSKQVKDISHSIGYTFDERLTNQNQRRNGEMKVEVKNLTGYHVAYVRVIGELSKEKISPAFDKVIKWAEARDLIGPETLYIGVALDNPNVTPKNKCRYDACVTVPPDTKGEREVGIYEIPSGKYAIYHAEGEEAKINAQINDAWDKFMGEWFPDSGYQPASPDLPCFEIYRETEKDKKAGRFVVDLCEPVKPL